MVTKRIRITEYVTETFEAEVELKEGEELTDEIAEEVRVNSEAEDKFNRSLVITDTSWEDVTDTD